MHICIYTHMCIVINWSLFSCGVCDSTENSLLCAIDHFIGLFCRILSLLWGSFAKETYYGIDDVCDSTENSHTSIENSLLIRTHQQRIVNVHTSTVDLKILKREFIQ